MFSNVDIVYYSFAVSLASSMTIIFFNIYYYTCNLGKNSIDNYGTNFEFLMCFLF